MKKMTLLIAFMLLTACSSTRSIYDVDSYFVGDVQTKADVKIHRFILKKNKKFMKLEVTCSGDCKEDKECAPIKDGLKVFTCVESAKCKKVEKILNEDKPEQIKDDKWLFNNH